VLKQWQPNADLAVKKYIYAGQMVPELMTLKDQLDDVDTLIVHFDSYFFRYTDEYIDEILNAVINLASRFTGSILLANQLSNGRNLSVLKTNIGQYAQGSIKHEASISKVLSAGNIFFYDMQKLVSSIGINNAYNFKLGFLYQMPYTKSMISLVAGELASLARFLKTPEKKAILVDCDNTLWKGILGEDGLEGIQCDRNAQGVLYFQFQEFLADKKKEGFILGLCSKNNEQDVKEAFEKLNMPLKWNDFLIRKVNWLNKEENLREAATELNVGLDSFIFIDDNEFELQSVNLILPEVTTRKLSPVYEDFLRLCDDYCFKRKRITAEDLEKNEQYLAEQKRNEAKSNVHSFEEYVASLGIKSDITVNNENDLPRLSQLTEKTNQFNFNKEPFSVVELEKFIASGSLIFGLRVSDKFGDYGLVGLILVEVNGRTAIMRNFLMSCRALGRLIENDFFDYVLADLGKRGVELSEIRFKETAKNKPARLFMDKLETGAKKGITA
jgi:FkbH-like protein